MQVVVGRADKLASPAAIGLRSLAFAGWCWREVERGDSNRVRESVLEVSRTVVGAGYAGLQQTVRTAWGCSEPDAPLAQACLGRTPKERRGFLARAFELLPESVRVVPDVEEDVCRRAFHYGVALNDVERLSPLDTFRGERPVQLISL